MNIAIIVFGAAVFGFVLGVIITCICEQSYQHHRLMTQLGMRNRQFGIPNSEPGKVVPLRPIDADWVSREIIARYPNIMRKLGE